eukprot:CAMPEP_0172679786 /NCGR_PEP_ID=MMETSP1074-20121228/16310_1 /TAXON_ID=2916 /ORGANISM="Ceratium fusus, Strain PA161109" /LENGTH=64 /DNA_ID=CAMNT_0013498017 /DNA_START=650 /DNA_END=841 /DNA_ORIENTATION=+
MACNCIRSRAQHQHGLATCEDLMRVQPLSCAADGEPTCSYQDLQNVSGYLTVENIIAICRHASS